MTNSLRSMLAAIALVAFIPAPVFAENSADIVLVGGKILTMDSQDRSVAAIALRDGRVLATGSDAEIRRFIGDETQVVELDGKTVIPGIIAAHCHAVGVARNALDRPHVELLTIAEVQAWVRERAKSVPAGTWIRVPRAYITRLKERRHPTPKELDAAKLVRHDSPDRVCPCVEPPEPIRSRSNARR